MNIPFLDLQRQYALTQRELDTSIGNVMRSFRFIRGKEVDQFENAFAGLLNLPNCTSTGNGTDSIFLALMGLGLKPGDEVITPAFSWISSAETISSCGATPVFVDVDPEFYTLDPQLIAEKITPKRASSQPNAAIMVGAATEMFTRSA